MLETELQGLYNELFSYRNEMACKFDADTRLIVVNEAYARAMNATQDELIGKKFIDLIPQEEHAEVFKHLRALTEKSPERTYEHKVILPDGTEKWQQWYDRAVFDSEGNLEYFISLGRDITRQKLLELEVEHRNRFQAILADLAIRLVNLPVQEFDAAMDDVLSIVGIYTQMEYACVFFRNPSGAITKRFYWTEHKDVKTQLKKYSHVFAEFETLTDDQDANTLYIEEIGKMSEKHPARKKLYPHGVKSLITTPLIQEKKVAGIVCFFSVSESRFISDTEVRLLKVLAELISNVETRRAYENKLIEAWNEAESANEAKTQFLANMSHEIRTPLNGMIGMSALLLSTPLDERQKKYANVLVSSGESLQYIVNDLLDMNKLSGKKLSLDRSVFRLSDVIADVTELLKIEAVKKALAYDVEIHEDKPGLVLRGAKLRFKQILTNLVGNAIKFTSKGGVRIECIATQEPEKKGTIKVLCRVTDTGIGIDKSQFSKLFKPFSQVDTGTKRKYSGTGLGLHISKTIVTQLGGDIGIESTPGIRTTAWFYVYFEAISKEAAAWDHGIRSREQQSNLDVLLVAFPQEAARFMQRELELLQLRCVAVPAIEDAGNLLNDSEVNANPDFIFIDFNKMGREALAFTDQLKNDFKHMNRKVVLIADAEDQLDPSWIEIHDIYRMLSRPITIEKLISVVFEEARNRIPDKSKATAVTPPQTPQKRTKHPPADTKQTKPKSGKRVLIAEDNPVNQELISIIMQDLNVSFDIVGNGLEAVHAVQDKTYDIILMDCQMPEMDGFEATRSIRSLDDAEKNKVPIIAVTAHVISGYQQKCEEAGMNGYISKPYSVKDLRNAIFGHKPEHPVLQGDDFRALKIIDYDRYIRRFGNDTELCSRILVRFVEETEKQLNQMKPLWTERSYQKLYDFVHSIKGASANIDAERMFSAAQKLSAAIERRQDQIIPKRMERLQNEFGRLRTKLEQTQYSVTPEIK